MDVTLSQLQSSLANAMQAQGIDRFGMSPLHRPLTFAYYQQWVQEGLHGEMKYLEDHRLAKEQPEILLPQAKSVISVAIDYVDHPAPIKKWPLKALPVALYAKGYDYHCWLKEKLRRVCRELQAAFPNEAFLAMTDSHPVLERDWAERSGLGWFGKNTCLISRQNGSFFLIGEIYSTLDINIINLQPSTHHCGTCQKCIEACPTKALERPLRLNATKCISYWTIEAKSIPDESLRQSVGEWFFGCDICQSVCPWNLKVFGKEKITNQNLSRELLIQDVHWILTSSNRQLLKAFSGTALLRAGGKRLKRNAILCAVHYQLTELNADLQSLKKTSADLSDLIDWALGQLSQNSLP